MKISVVTVCLNSAETIEDTITSVERQDYDNIEHIIVDGDSADGTMEIINKHRDSISRVISEKDNGIYEAMNKGLRHCTGEVLGFLNADDFYADETALSQVADCLEANALDAVYGDLIYVDKLDTAKMVRYWKPGEYKQKAFLGGWVMPHPTFFCRRNIYEKYGGFNNDFKIAADFELMLRFVERHNIKIGYLPKSLVKMRSGGKANVLKGIIRGNIEIIKSFRLNGLHLSPWFFIKKPITKISQITKRTAITKQ